MEFRFVALIALWTLLSGPMFGTAPPSPAEQSVPTIKKAEGRTPRPDLPSPPK